MDKVYLFIELMSAAAGHPNARYFETATMAECHQKALELMSGGDLQQYSCTPVTPEVKEPTMTWDRI